MTGAAARPKEAVSTSGRLFEEASAPKTGVPYEANGLAHPVPAGSHFWSFADPGRGHRQAADTGQQSTLGGTGISLGHIMPVKSWVSLNIYHPAGSQRHMQTCQCRQGDLQHSSDAQWLHGLGQCKLKVSTLRAVLCRPNQLSSSSI